MATKGRYFREGREGSGYTDQVVECESVASGNRLTEVGELSGSQRRVVNTHVGISVMTVNENGRD